MESNKISVCIVVNDNLFESTYCVLNLIAKTNLPFSLYVYDFKDNVNLHNKISKALHEYNNLKSYSRVSRTKSLSFAYNDFLNNCKTEYAVIVPSNVIVNDSWLNELKYAYINFENSGCISIKENSENLKLSSKLFVNTKLKEDQMKTVYVDDKNFFKDFVFFETKKGKEMGYFNEDPVLKGLEMSEWTFRFFAKGYPNFYLTYNNVIRLKTVDEILNPDITNEAKKLFRLIANTSLTIEKNGE
jgi:hypothetical protein